MLYRTLKRILNGRNHRNGIQAPAGGPFAEPLEVRRHFNVTGSLTSGVLTITGDTNNNTITVYEINGGMVHQIKVDVNSTGGDLGPWNVTDIDLIKLNGGSGSETLVAESDLFGISHGGFPVSELVEFYGNSGNDVIYGSDNADMMDGGPDNDTLKGGRGSDTMYGGNGSDRLEGNDDDSGADYMYGGADSDTIFAQDTYFDYIDGGTESDTLSSWDDGTDTVLNIP